MILDLSCNPDYFVTRIVAEGGIGIEIEMFDAILQTSYDTNIEKNDKKQIYKNVLVSKGFGTNMKTVCAELSAGNHPSPPNLCLEVKVTSF